MIPATLKLCPTSYVGQAFQPVSGPAGKPVPQAQPARCAAPTLRSRATLAAPVVLGAILMMSVPACSHTKQRHKPAILVTRGNLVDYVRDALEHDDADIRRGAIDQLAKTRHARLPAVIDAIALAARTDKSDSVRRAALRALGRLGGRKALDTCLALLGGATGGSNVRPAGDELRWESATALRRMAESGSWHDATHRAIRETAIGLLAGDPSRDVRLCGAQLLGDYPYLESVRALIAALGQRDFGVVYESQRSLMRLTGEAHGLDPARWQRWLESTDDPFAASHAHKTSHRFSTAVRLGQPG